MFKSYLTTALRVLVKNKLYSAINIFGLAVGIASCLLILMFVLDEFSYDSFWPDAERVYRVQTTYHTPGSDPLVTVRAAGKYKHWFDSDLSGVTSVARLRPIRSVVKKDGQVFAEDISFVDPEFFDIFKMDPIAGDIESVRGDAAALIASESFARKYFGDQSAIGQVLTLTVYDRTRDYKVAAVVADAPHNSHFIWDAFVFIHEPDFVNQPWEFNFNGLNNLLYYKLQSGADAEEVAAQIPDSVDKNYPMTVFSGHKLTPSDFVKFRVVNVRDIQLRGGPGNNLKPVGDITTVYGLSAIALLILVIAAINFVNLTTARSTRRAREVSLRKAVGASRRDLVVQFIGESVVLSLVSLSITVVLVGLFLPWFNGFTNKALTLSPLDNPALVLSGVGLALVLGVLGGLYPAFYVSRFRPAAVLQANKSSETVGPTRLRSALVIIQFAISVTLAIGTLVVYSQTTYARTMDPGYYKENVILLRQLWDEPVIPVTDTLMAEIRSLPGVLSLGRSSRAPGDNGRSIWVVRVPDSPSLGALPNVDAWHIDDTFVPTYGIKLLAGRNFDRGRPADIYPPNVEELPEEALVASAILNETALHHLAFGTPAEAIGRQFKVSSNFSVPESPEITLTIIGVMPDVHFGSLRGAVDPEMFIFNPPNTGMLSIRYDSEAARELTAQIEGVWNRLIPDLPIKYQFLDEHWAAQYVDDERQGQMFGVFAVLAIVIACLGLYGLASFTAETRTKEIGIRKVMGARTRDIARLLLWQFSQPVVLANIIAWPAAWFITSEWLSSYAYRIDLTPGYFLGATVVALLIAWATVAIHVARVAQASPITALRYE